MRLLPTTQYCRLRRGRLRLQLLKRRFLGALTRGLFGAGRDAKRNNAGSGGEQGAHDEESQGRWLILTASSTSIDSYGAHLTRNHSIA